MALSNILREPRREITETLFGMGALAIPILADVYFAVWFHKFTGPNNACPIPVGMIIGILFFAFTGILLLISHVFGEWICDSLADRGLDPRPKQRYRR
jgi:hypothetical protein